MKKINPFNEETKKLQKRYQQTDIGTSNLFADIYGDELVFVSDQKEWYSFDGKRWNPDYELRRYQLIKDMAEYMTALCFKTFQSGDEQLQMHLKYYFNLTKKTFRDKILKDAESVRTLTSDKFNRHKFLFNCENGTFNIKTGKLQKHDPKDFLTDMSNVCYNPKAEAPRFIQYLKEVMQGDKTKIDYLTKWGGLVLTGDTTKEAFLILYGDVTRNGKSTFITTLSWLLGSYSKTALAESFQRKENSNGGQAASGDIARLKEARMVVASEMNQNMRLDIALMKRLTGGDTITARHLYKSEMEYIPQFKIIFNTNFLPQMSDDTIFKSDRLHILEFKRHFTVEERNLNLKEELKEEVNGIFNILLKSYYRLEKEGFIIPEESKKTLKQYELESNRAKQFIGDRLIQTGNEKEDYVQVKTVWESFQAWCERNGYKAGGKARFISEIKRAGLTVFEGSKKLPEGSGFYKTNWVLGVLERKEQPIEKQQRVSQLLEIDDDPDLPF